MLRAAKKVIVTIMPTRLDASLMRGDKIVSSNTVELDPVRWDFHWAQGLHSLDAPLTELLRSLRAQKCPTHVLYLGREVQSDVSSFAMNQDEAVSAARLAQNSEIAGSRQGLCRVLWTQDAPALKSHVLVASDRNESLIMLSAWVRRSGGLPASCLPLSVPQIVESVAKISGIVSDRPLCRVLMGEHTTVLVGSADGKIAFARSADMGFSLLVKALVQASSDSPTPLSYPAAREYLLKYGLPSRSNWADGPIRADRAMPLAYPVLQRYTVECRQTLRFGFGTDQSHVSVELSGPGASIIGLSEALSSQLECDVTSAGSPAELDLASVQPILTASGFLAEFERDERRLRSFNSGIGLGLTLAFLLLAGEFALLRNARGNVDQKLSAQASRVTLATEELHLRRDASKLATELGNLQHAIGLAERNKIDTYSVLGELTRITPDNVFIQELSFAISDEYTILGLRGTVTSTDETDADPLSDFLIKLRNDELVETVELGSTHVFEESGVRNKEFSISARLRRAAHTTTGDKQ